jgi:hypothetical protein
MLLTHHIDIGKPKPPLLFPEMPWSDEEVIGMVEELQSFSRKKYQLEK